MCIVIASLRYELGRPEKVIHKEKKTGEKTLDLEKLKGLSLPRFTMMVGTIIFFLAAVLKNQDQRYVLI